MGPCTIGERISLSGPLLFTIGWSYTTADDGPQFDFFEAIESSPMNVASLDCSGTDDKGGPVSVKTGALTLGSFGREAPYQRAKVSAVHPSERST